MPELSMQSHLLARGTVATVVVLAVWAAVSCGSSDDNGGGGAATKTVGDDIWVAPANGLSAIVAMPVGRLASVTDCDATPAGLMFDLTGSKLFLNLTGRSLREEAA